MYACANYAGFAETVTYIYKFHTDSTYILPKKRNNQLQCDFKNTGINFVNSNTSHLIASIICND